jgi:hypothetical protein
MRVSRSPPTVPLDGRSSNADRDSVVLAVSLLELGSVCPFTGALIDTSSTRRAQASNAVLRSDLMPNNADSSSSLASFRHSNF